MLRSMRKTQLYPEKMEISDGAKSTMKQLFDIFHSKYIYEIITLIKEEKIDLYLGKQGYFTVERTQDSDHYVFRLYKQVADPAKPR